MKGVSLSHDGSRAVSIDVNGSAHLLKLATADLDLAPIPLGNIDVNDAQFSPDGSIVATAGVDGSVQLWDRDGHELAHGPFHHEGTVLSLAFTPNGKSLVGGCRDGTARIWDLETTELRGEVMSHGSPVRWVVQSPDGSQIVTAGSDGSIRLWTGAGEPAPFGPLRHEGTIRSVTFSPDGQLLLTGGQDGTARVWRTDTGELHIPPLKHRLWVFHAAFSPNGQRILTASHDGTAKVWDAATGGRVNTQPIRHDQAVRFASFSRDGRRVATAGFDGIASVWNATTGEPLSPPLHHPAQVMCVQFDPSGRVLTAGWDWTVRLWDLEVPGLASALVSDQRLLTRLPSIRRAGDSPPLGVTGGSGFGEVAGGRQICPSIEHFGSVQRVEFIAPTASGWSRPVWTVPRVWDTTTGKPQTPPLRHAHSVRQATFSPDGRFVATASLDGSARVWEAGTGRAVAPL